MAVKAPNKELQSLIRLSLQFNWGLFYFNACTLFNSELLFIHTVQN